ncbi:MAG TPA: NYN domain-containing protein [Candidatus Aphodovivens avicola]|nr:NYN domain-containing protein [Candidatus Aphodovivens avicola]
MDKQPSEKRFALLIDADNVSAKYIKPITDELSNYGTVTIKRIYGDWTLSLHAKWKDALLENSLTPIQQFGYTQGKNATDSAMIIDAMDILYTGSVDGFCIVSSDSDFTRLASRLRESGRMVIGMGEKKTPTPFRRACDVFTTLELLLDDANGKRKGKGAGSGPSIEEVEQAVVRIITDNQNNGKATGLGEVGSRLLKRFPDFDVRSYGTNLLSKLLGKFASVTITKRGSDVSVELVDDKEQSKEAPREADASASDGKADKAEKAEEAEKLEKAGEPAEESSDAEAKSEEDAAQAEDASDSSSRRRRRRRGGTRASRRRSAAESAESTTLEDGDAPSEPEEAGEIPEEQIADPEQGEKAEEGAPEQETSQQKAAEQKASQQDTSKQEASEVDASQSADETPRPKAQKPKRKTRRGAKKDDGASHESASAKAGKHASAEEAKSVSSEGAKPASAKGAKHDSGKGAKPSSGKNAKPGSDKAGKPASAEAAKPASELAEVDATTRRLVAEAGAAGIEMSQLASLVRAAHRGFKVRDHGHAQFKSYVASLGDIEIERIGKEWFARMGE